ncbi:MAG: hypothetical protein JRF48_08440 [Deltaproteobacteria bacterium]|nr:hypothetical protein [Deltaproteobacteria bacterium]
MNKLLSKKEGFTLIELINYVKRSKTSEAGANLKSMFQGAAAYYEAENWGQGLTTAGATAAASTHCTVDDAFQDGAPSDAKRTINWQGETNAAAFTAVNFAPADPLYYDYNMDATPNASACGNGPSDTTDVDLPSRSWHQPGQLAVSRAGHQQRPTARVIDHG